MKNLSTANLTRLSSIVDTKNVSCELRLTSAKSVNISIDSLFSYFFNYDEYDKNKMYNMFDVFHSTQNLNNKFYWSLNVDASGKLNISNKSAPNWLYGYYRKGVDSTISTINVAFWNSLIQAKNRNKIRFELITGTTDSIISSSTYMKEYNQNGFTNIFLIDETNGYVALPCLNSSFLRCVDNTSATSVINLNTFDVDKIKTHAHNTVTKYYDTTAYTLLTTTYTNYISDSIFKYIQTDNQTSGGTETCPNSVQYNTYICVKSDITPPVINITYTKPNTIPIGAVLPYSNKILNNKNYLICDGTQYPISEYQELFSKIGHTFCTTSKGWMDVSDRSTYFRVPDIRGRYVLNRTTDVLTSKYVTPASRINTFNHIHGTGTNIGVYTTNFLWPTLIQTQSQNLAGSYGSVVTDNYQTPYATNPTILAGGTDGTTDEIYKTPTTQSIDLAHVSINYIIKAK